MSPNEHDNQTQIFSYRKSTHSKTLLQLTIFEIPTFLFFVFSSNEIDSIKTKIKKYEEKMVLNVVILVF